MSRKFIHTYSFLNVMTTLLMLLVPMNGEGENLREEENENIKWRKENFSQGTFVDNF